MFLLLLLLSFSREKSVEILVKRSLFAYLSLSLSSLITLETEIIHLLSFFVFIFLPIIGCVLFSLFFVRMFGSRAFTSTQAGHRCTSSAKFTNTRQADHEVAGRLICSVSIWLASTDICSRTISNCWKRRWNTSQTKFSVCLDFFRILSYSRWVIDLFDENEPMIDIL